MFNTLKQRLFLSVYITLILSIPIGAYIISQDSEKKPSYQDKLILKQTITQGPISSPPTKSVQGVSKTLAEEPIPTAEPSPAVATLFGPTLNFKVQIEGRGKDNQTGRFFIGILEGALKTNPKFLLSYTLNLPASGEFSGLSLAGLETGTVYTAILKGPAQIATSSAFTLSPTTTTLNSGNPIFLTSGDLNEDNVINTSDYSFIRNILGASEGSSNWNENADFNKDGIINTFDAGIIVKNLGKTGASGAWISSTQALGGTSNEATPSALPSGSAEQPIQTKSPDGSKGYWIWVPK